MSPGFTSSDFLKSSVFPDLIVASTFAVLEEVKQIRTEAGLLSPVTCPGKKNEPATPVPLNSVPTGRRLMSSMAICLILFVRLIPRFRPYCESDVVKTVDILRQP